MESKGAVNALGNNPVASACERLLLDATKVGASTIHMEPLEEYAQVRYRVDGLLYECGQLSHRALNALVEHIKDRAQLPESDRPSPQEGTFTFKANGQTYHIAVDTIPVAKGEKAVLHLTTTQIAQQGFEALGMWGETKKQFAQALTAHQGLIVVTGPHLSGTSTTLESITPLISSPTRHVANIEERIAHPNKYTTQFRARPFNDVSILKGLNAALRTDADVITISELQDAHILNASLNSASHGRLMIGAIHRVGLAHTLTHLIGMSEQEFLLAHELQAVVHQRLARRLCDNCKQSVRPNVQTLRVLTNAAHVTLGTLHNFMEDTRAATQESLGIFQARIGGCTQCHYTGYRGQLGLFEVMPISEMLQRQIVAKTSPMLLIQQAMKEGMMPIKVDGLIKAFCGLTSIEEVVRVTRGS
jgi:type II secretory ATPase GspE/PulE/Tfp pilus assembly ATPase PilB-like protein